MDEIFIVSDRLSELAQIAIEKQDHDLAKMYLDAQLVILTKM